MNKGGSGCTPKKKCTTCQGDCDSDADCQSGLKCFQRNTATVLVPGCGKGGHGDQAQTDYCYHPGALVTKGINGCTTSNKCSKCQGDCDSDADCRTGLKCYQRNDKRKITGCFAGGNGDVKGWDFCYVSMAYMLSAEIISDCHACAAA